MQKTLQIKNLKNTLKNQVFNKLDGFFYSVNYLLLLGLISVFSFAFNMQMGGFSIYIIICCYLLVRQRDSTPILPLVIYFITVFRDLSVTSSILFYILLIPVLVCLIIHFIKFPPIPFCFGKLFLPFFAITSAMLVGGLLSPHLADWHKGLLYAIPLGPGLMLIYLFFNNYLRPPEDFDSKKYFSIALVIMGFICSIDILIYSINKFTLLTSEFATSHVGWANTNGVGAIMLVVLPACCYLLVKSKNVFCYTLMVLTFYVTIFLTKSDGALGISCVFLPILIFFVYKKLPKKQRQAFLSLIGFIAIIGCLTIIALQYNGLLESYLASIKKSFKSDTGRSKLYRDAIQNFLKNPIFGVGLGYYNDASLNVAINPLSRFNFHSTFFTSLACMGSFGLLAYFYYFYKRYAIITERNTYFNKFMFIAFSMFECYGFIDVCEFITSPQMITITFLILITDLTNIKGNENSLPLIFY